MTLYQSFFVKFQNYNMKVYLINEISVKVIRMNKTEIFFNEKKLTLNEVLYVSKLNENLLSIRAVSSHRITVKF